MSDTPNIDDNADTGTVPVNIDDMKLDNTSETDTTTSSSSSDNDSGCDQHPSANETGCVMDSCDHVVHCLHPEQDPVEMAEVNLINSEAYAQVLKNKKRNFDQKVKFTKKAMKLDRKKWKHAVTLRDYKTEFDCTQKHRELLEQYQGHFYEDWLKNNENGRNCKMDQINANYDQDYKYSVECLKLSLEKGNNQYERFKAESDNRMAMFRQEYDHKVTIEKLDLEDHRIQHEVNQAKLRCRLGKAESDAELLKHYGAFLPEHIVFCETSLPECEMLCDDCKKQ